MRFPQRALEEIKEFVDTVEPQTVSTGRAAELVKAFAELERLSVAGKVLGQVGAFRASPNEDLRLELIVRHHLWRRLLHSDKAVPVSETESGLHVTEHVPSHDVDDASPLVVLVHGSLDRGTSFARVVRRLPSLRVVTYDRRGYHRSRSERALAHLASDVVGGHVADVLEVIGGRPSIVVGHSFGGDVALGAAIESPGCVLAVGAYEPPLPWTQWWPRRSNREGPREDPAVAAEAFFRRVVSDEAWERLTDNARSDRRADGPALVAEMAALRDGRAPFDVRQLSVPLVLGRGERSISHHRRAIDVLVEMVPDAEVVEIPGATHGAHLSHPDSFAAFVKRVVERSTGRKAERMTDRPGGTAG